MINALPPSDEEPIKVNNYQIIKKSLHVIMEGANEDNASSTEDVKFEWIKYSLEQNDFYLSYVSGDSQDPPENKLAFWIVYPLNDSSVCIIFSTIENQNKMTDELAQRIYNDFQCFPLN
ncbi:MAG: hypothetical protein DBX47_07730 [Clostridiales bacterium]|nr:MAG: hypothetical protein DBX47_07730 [Clostridiales bacterium]